MPSGATEEVAIIGIGCRLPAGIETPKALWNLLVKGGDGITEIPESRWSSRFYHPDPAVVGASYSRWAGLVERPEEFDAALFGISPREAQRLDPQQRWFLEATWRALEDAGQRLEDLRGRSVGVFLGCSSSDYGDIQRRWPHLIEAHTNTGSAVSLVANRVSYTFDFRGPSLAVDTACSSSLVALDLALRAIRSGQCEMAVVGGVNALFMPEASIGFAKASMLSRDGRCKAFDARADGYVRAEGAVALLLKPAVAALAEEDRIYASVLSTAVNQDGRTAGLTVPSETQQRALLDVAFAEAGLDPAWVAGIEAHGTGTPVGDPIEARALGGYFRGERSADAPLWIGSVKTNLGHLEPASGGAGLIKLALCLERGRMVPSLHFHEPNPQIDFAGLGLQVPTTVQEWTTAPDGRRYGGVNSFGFGGTNAHAVLASAPQPDRVGSEVSGPIVWLLSARSEAALAVAVTEAQSFWSETDEADLARLAQVQARRRSAHSYRLALVASDKDQLREKAALLDPAKAGRRVSQSSSRCLFVFSGQGSQWHGMARDLVDVGPAAQDMAMRIDRLMPPVAGRTLLEALRDPDPAHCDRTEIVQPLLFAQQLMLAAQLTEWGIEAHAVCGHSVGEVAAACWAGVLSLEDAVTVVHHRSRLQEWRQGSGGMAAIGLPAAAVADRLTRYVDLHLAAINSPQSTTVAGDSEQLAAFCASLRAEDVFARTLTMPYAFHCPHMDGLDDELEAALSHIVPRPGTLAFSRQ